MNQTEAFQDQRTHQITTRLIINDEIKCKANQDNLHAFAGCDHRFGHRTRYETMIRVRYDSPRLARDLIPIYSITDLIFEDVCNNVMKL